MKSIKALTYLIIFLGAGTFTACEDSTDVDNLIDNSELPESSNTTGGGGEKAGLGVPT